MIHPSNPVLNLFDVAIVLIALTLQEEQEQANVGLGRKGAYAENFRALNEMGSPIRNICTSKP